MAAFQDTRAETEQKVMVHLLSEIERNPSFTQRGLAGELGIALGLMNQYLKRCLTKGWIRASQVSARRITYFLTPEGFKEKSLMVKDYLSRSMAFFRDAREQCEEVFKICKNKNYTRIALVGDSDLADIAKLVASGTGINVEIIKNDKDIKSYDAILITDILNPQAAYERLENKVEASQIFTLDLLHVSRAKP